MTLTDYLTACGLQKEIVIIDGLDEVIRQQKGIGRNLNQLTVLAHEGRIQLVNLEGVESALEKSYIGIQQLAELERR